MLHSDHPEDKVISVHARNICSVLQLLRSFENLSSLDGLNCIPTKNVCCKYECNKWNKCSYTYFWILKIVSLVSFQLLQLDTLNKAALCQWQCVCVCDLIRGKCGPISLFLWAWGQLTTIPLIKLLILLQDVTMPLIRPCTSWYLCWERWGSEASAFTVHQKQGSE